MATLVCMETHPWMENKKWETRHYMGQSDQFWMSHRLLITKCQKSTHLLIHGDNNRVIEGWWNDRSCNREVNFIFRQIHQLILNAPHSISFHTVYVASNLNPTDAPSGAIYPPPQESTPPIHPTPPWTQWFCHQLNQPIYPNRTQAVLGRTIPKNHAKNPQQFEQGGYVKHTKSP